jgi:hypothetical protein
MMCIPMLLCLFCCFLQEAWTPHPSGWLLAPRYQLDLNEPQQWSEGKFLKKGSQYSLTSY